MCIRDRCPHRESAARQSAVGEHAVECANARCHLFRGLRSARERSRIRKALLDQCTQRGDGGSGHLGPSGLSRDWKKSGGSSYTEQKPKARRSPQKMALLGPSVRNVISRASLYIQLKLLRAREPLFDDLSLSVGRAAVMSVRHPMLLAERTHRRSQSFAVRRAHFVVERVRRPVSLGELRKFLLDERQ